MRYFSPEREASMRAKCRHEVERDRIALSNGARIEPAHNEWEVACYLWGKDVADRLYPEMVPRHMEVQR